MSKVLGVIGATGNQGGSVIDFVLNDQQLSAQYRIRAFTRDASKDSGQALRAKGVEVIEADVADKSSLVSAFKGVNVLFAMTSLGPDGSEVAAGKNLADAAVQSGVQYIIFSTLPPSNKISNGKYYIPHFEEKAEVEQYIRSLGIKSSFFLPSSFMENFYTSMKPQKQSDGTYVIEFLENDGNPRFPFIDIKRDTGNYVGYILNHQDECQGKVIFGAVQSVTAEELAQVMSKSTGKTITVRKVPRDKYLSFLPAQMHKAMCDMYDYLCEYELVPDVVNRIKQDSKYVVKPLTTLEQYLADYAIPN
uniref:ARAD1D08866p n=1 Tax=Blastobotrys adeninivorans TaxID=409370 RepID=A0A060T883_BLAAD